MKNLRISIVIILLIIVVGSYFDVTFKNLTVEEAEQIALKDAIANGYDTATLWKEFNTQTTKRYIYSEKYEKDVKIWQVNLDTTDHPDNIPAFVYYIKEDTGEIIGFINVVDNVVEK
ncbi:hypothetical protein JOD29_000509 [Lysinibacillus composti]|uniref:Uncharacterized protein n=1 Tax=Lysinibacillus composti TaxID=720633 RepID=A0A3N9UUP1_9BACI|nr:hypothetical protein [Lysinibacillus composti]MBM7607272.1 hypothetical protein [Lysinibacillus composti]RQW76152.1 hypothetical protein EBB45_00975 [Lysinibacillus composti]